MISQTEFQDLPLLLCASLESLSLIGSHPGGISSIALAPAPLVLLPLKQAHFCLQSAVWRDSPWVGSIALVLEQPASPGPPGEMVFTLLAMPRGTLEQGWGTSLCPGPCGYL